MTLDEARQLAIAKHREAVTYLHQLVASPGLCDDAWPKLMDARKDEASAAHDVCVVNGVIQTAGRLAEKKGTT